MKLIIERHFLKNYVCRVAKHLQYEWDERIVKREIESHIAQATPATADQLYLVRNTRRVPLPRVNKGFNDGVSFLISPDYVMFILKETEDARFGVTCYTCEYLKCLEPKPAEVVLEKMRKYYNTAIPGMARSHSQWMVGMYSLQQNGYEIYHSGTPMELVAINYPTGNIIHRKTKKGSLRNMIGMEKGCFDQFSIRCPKTNLFYTLRKIDPDK